MLTLPGGSSLVKVRSREGKGQVGGNHSCLRAGRILASASCLHSWDCPGFSPDSLMSQKPSVLGGQGWSVTLLPAEQGQVSWLVPPNTSPSGSVKCWAGREENRSTPCACVALPGHLRSMLGG